MFPRPSDRTPDPCICANGFEHKGQMVAGRITTRRTSGASRIGGRSTVARALDKRRCGYEVQHHDDQLCQEDIEEGTCLSSRPTTRQGTDCRRSSEEPRMEQQCATQRIFTSFNPIRPKYIRLRFAEPLRRVSPSFQSIPAQPTPTIRAPRLPRQKRPRQLALPKTTQHV